MKARRRSLAGVLLTIFFVVPCFAHHLAVVVDKGNKVDNVTSAHLVRIFKSEAKK